MDKTVSVMKTKLNKTDTNPKVTTVTYDWKGVTMEMLQPIATDGFNINLQGKFRRAKTIPATTEVKVLDLIAGMGSRQIPATVEGVAAVAGTMKPEEVEALIAKLREESKARTAAANPKPEKGKGKQQPPAKSDGGGQPNA